MQPAARVCYTLCMVVVTLIMTHYRECHTVDRRSVHINVDGEHLNHTDAYYTLIYDLVKNIYLIHMCL